MESVNNGYLQWMLKNFPESSSCGKVIERGGMKHRREAEKVIYNVHTLLSELKSCSIRRDLLWGKRIHVTAIETRYDSNVYVLTALIRMYAKCGSMFDARNVFDSIRNPAVVSWSALLLGYVENGDGLNTLELFMEMKACGCVPNSVTYVAVLKACTSLLGKQEQGDCLKCGRQIHSEIGFNLNIFVQNSLVDMYSKCGSMADARSVFDSIKKPDVVSWTTLLLGYAENGEGLATLELFLKMKACGCVPNSITYVAALKACTSLLDKQQDGGQGECLHWGREIHAEIGCDMNIFVQNTLMDMYAKCGSMAEARTVFESIQKPDVVSWNALLLGYVENGEALSSLELYSKMKASGYAPNSVTYVAALKGCTSMAVNLARSKQDECLQLGRQIHSEIGCDLNIFVQNTLVDMYAKCGSMADARHVFDSIQQPNVVSWTNLLLGYADNGDGLATLDLFSKMKACGCVVDSVAYVAALKACTSLAEKRDAGGQGECLKRGREIHSEIGRDLNIFVQNTLIDMYGKCGSMTDAREVFDSILKPNLVSWSALLQGYAENGDGLATLKLFSRMTTCGCSPDSVTYVAAIKACGLLGALAIGRELHLGIREFSAHVVTCLVDFYAKCGSMAEACEVFDSHTTARIVSTWNALLAGYGSFGDTDSVFNLFEVMKDQMFCPDDVTFVCILSCCSHAGLVEKARGYLKAMPVEYGVAPTVMHYNCMVDVLGRANQLEEAIALLQKMPCNSDAVTWMTLLGACRKWKNVEVGRCAFRSLMEMDKENAPAYVLMAHIYGSRCMWEEQKRLSDRRTKIGAGNSEL